MHHKSVPLIFTSYLHILSLSLPFAHYIKLSTVLEESNEVIGPSSRHPRCNESPMSPSFSAAKESDSPGTSRTGLFQDPCPCNRPFYFSFISPIFTVFLLTLLLLNAFSIIPLPVHYIPRRLNSLMLSLFPLTSAITSLTVLLQRRSLSLFDTQHDYCTPCGP